MIAQVLNRRAYFLLPADTEPSAKEKWDHRTQVHPKNYDKLHSEAAQDGVQRGVLGDGKYQAKDNSHHPEGHGCYPSPEHIPGWRSIRMAYCCITLNLLVSWPHPNANGEEQDNEDGVANDHERLLHSKAHTKTRGIAKVHCDKNVFFNLAFRRHRKYFVTTKQC